MECTARILRERKVLLGSSGSKSEMGVQIYCPILGEITLFGDRARQAIEKIKEKAKEKARA